MTYTRAVILLFVTFTLLLCADGQKCVAMVKGRRLTFPKCIQVKAGFMVFWRVRKGRLTTVLQARTNGYFAFGWGYDEMVGSKVHVVYPKGKKATASMYALKGKNAAGVSAFGRKVPAFISSGVLTAMFTRNIRGAPRLRVGKLNFAIWAHGKRPARNGVLAEHLDRGFISVKL